MGDDRSHGDGRNMQYLRNAAVPGELGEQPQQIAQHHEHRQHQQRRENPAPRHLQAGNKGIGQGVGLHRFEQQCRSNAQQGGNEDSDQASETRGAVESGNRPPEPERQQRNDESSSRNHGR